VAGLLLIEMMVYRNKNMLKILNETEKQFGRYYYVRADQHLEKQVELKKDLMPKEILGKIVAEVKDYDGIKLILSDGSWLMLRGSGTEPLMRVYAEAKNLGLAKKILEVGKAISKQL
jgi:phosphomannomutase